MLTKFAQQGANNRVLLFPDQDEGGKAGFKELMWSLNERMLSISLAAIHGTVVTQPEDLKNWLG